MTTKKKEEGTKLAPQTQSSTPAKAGNGEPSMSGRFTEMVIREFTGAVANPPPLTGFQKRLIQNYFISTDLSLKMAEEKRLKKSKNYQDPVAITWANVNMQTLALNVVACAKIGFDPALPNHINMIPYKNNTTQKYDIGFIEGYRGKEIKAMKYGFLPPDDVVIEVVYSNDKFRPIKKDQHNEVETYTFEISEDPFDRGEIVGGFYYHVYKDEPRRNTLVFFNKHEIEKRKPKYASAEFWGGEKAIYKDGKRTKATEKVEGWYAEMVHKTIYRAAYGSLTIDSEKIDDHLMQLMGAEKEFNDSYAVDISDPEGKQQIINDKGNKKPLNVEEAQVVPELKAEEKAQAKEEKPEQHPQSEAESTPGKENNGEVLPNLGF